MGVAIFLHWGANFLVAQTFPILLNEFEAGPVFLGYAVIGVIAAVFVTTKVEETKGRSLEAIEEQLQDEAPSPA